MVTESFKDKMSNLQPEEEKILISSIRSLKRILFERKGRALDEINVFDSSKANHVFKTLVLHFLPIRSVEISKWTEDAEEFCLEEDADNWEVDFRVSRVSKGLR
jgi:hypothetical protein